MTLKVSNLLTDKFRFKFLGAPSGSGVPDMTHSRTAAEPQAVLQPYCPCPVFKYRLLSLVCEMTGISSGDCGLPPASTRLSGEYIASRNCGNQVALRSRSDSTQAGLGVLVSHPSNSATEVNRTRFSSIRITYVWNRSRMTRPFGTYTGRCSSANKVSRCFVDEFADN